MSPSFHLSFNIITPPAAGAPPSEHYRDFTESSLAAQSRTGPFFRAASRWTMGNVSSVDSAVPTRAFSIQPWLRPLCRRRDKSSYRHDGPQATSSNKRHGPPCFRSALFSPLSHVSQSPPATAVPLRRPLRPHVHSRVRRLLPRSHLLLAPFVRVPGPPSTMRRPLPLGRVVPAGKPMSPHISNASTLRSTPASKNESSRGIRGRQGMPNSFSATRNAPLRARTNNWPPFRPLVIISRLYGAPLFQGTTGHELVVFLNVSLSGRSTAPPHRLHRSVPTRCVSPRMTASWFSRPFGHLAITAEPYVGPALPRCFSTVAIQPAARRSRDTDSCRGFHRWP